MSSGAAGACRRADVPPQRPVNRRIERTGEEAVRVERAVTTDLGPILRLRRAYEAWLAGRGTPQWLPGELPDGAGADQLERGEWYVARAETGGPVGALRVLEPTPTTWRRTG